MEGRLMPRNRRFAFPLKAAPLVFFGFIAAVPFATFGAMPKNRLIMHAPDMQLVADIGNSGETR